MRIPYLASAVSVVVLISVAHPGCSNDQDDCAQNPKLGCGPYAPGDGGNATGGSGAGGTGGETSGGGGSGGGEPCGGICADPTPLCDPDTDSCVACLGNGDCAAAATPVCHEGACVACTPAEDALCTGQTPYCDPGTFSCVRCNYHEHCPESACNPFTGACLNATPQTVGPGETLTDVVAAFGTVDPFTEAVFRLAPYSGNNPYPAAALSAPSNAVVAVLADGGRPTLLAAGGPPTIQVFAGATLLLANLDLRGNTASRGLDADGLVALDAVEIASNNGGGISAGSGAELLIRNSIIAANGNVNQDAIVLAGAEAAIVYSSVAGVSEVPSAAISCSGGYVLTVRNSVLLKRHDTGSALAGCGTATVTNSHDDSIDLATGQSWFGAGWPSDLRLTPAGVTAFTDVAAWQTGDPPTDIDGSPRPSTDGTPDVAGADEGP